MECTTNLVPISIAKEIWKSEGVVNGKLHFLCSDDWHNIDFKRGAG